jgi:hypothetical protein
VKTGFADSIGPFLRLILAGYVWLAMNAGSLPGRNLPQSFGTRCTAFNDERIHATARN